VVVADQTQLGVERVENRLDVLAADLVVLGDGEAVRGFVRDEHVHVF
jgi:hypothetical protein